MSDKMKAYRKLPEPTSTPLERTIALQAAHPLVVSKGFASSSSAAVTDLIRLGEYITTGHDYADTHPVNDELNRAIVAERLLDSMDSEHITVTTTGGNSRTSESSE